MVSPMWLFLSTFLAAGIAVKARGEYVFNSSICFIVLHHQLVLVAVIKTDVYDNLNCMLYFINGTGNDKYCHTLVHPVIIIA